MQVRFFFEGCFDILRLDIFLTTTSFCVFAAPKKCELLVNLKTLKNTSKPIVMLESLSKLNFSVIFESFNPKENLKKNLDKIRANCFN